MHRRTAESPAHSQIGIDASPENRLTDPTGPCPTCGGWQWWQLPGQPWHCRSCLEMTYAEQASATTLTGGLWEPSA
jgi:hypothetical protein